VSAELVIYAGVEGTYGHGDGPVQRATFACPRAICGDAEGDMYVLDGDAQYVRHIGSGGEVRTLSLSATKDGTRIEVKSLRAIACASENELVVNADRRLWRGQVRLRTGKILLEEGPRVEFDRFLEGPNGRFVGTSSTDHTVVAVGWDGERETLYESDDLPVGIAMNASGELFINEGPHILKRSPTGAFEHYAPNNHPPSDWGLERWFDSSMRGMEFDSEGNLYVAELIAGVFRIDRDGMVESWAGTGEGIIDVHVSPSGYVFVADFDNHVIRRSFEPLTTA
jgi:hypothetical protein